MDIEGIFLGFICGVVIILGCAAVFADDQRQVDADRAKELRAACELDLPRNTSCRMVFVPDAPK